MNETTLKERNYARVVDEFLQDQKRSLDDIGQATLSKRLAALRLDLLNDTPYEKTGFEMWDAGEFRKRLRSAIEKTIGDDLAAALRESADRMGESATRMRARNEAAFEALLPLRISNPPEIELLTSVLEQDWGSPEDGFAPVGDGIRRATRGDFEALPASPSWGEVLCLSVMIDGYAIAEANLPVDLYDFHRARAALFERTGEWLGDALELWLVLFCYNRINHWECGAGFEPGGVKRTAMIAAYKTLRVRLLEYALLQPPVPMRPKFIPKPTA